MLRLSRVHFLESRSSPWYGRPDTMKRDQTGLIQNFFEARSDMKSSLLLLLLHSCHGVQRFVTDYGAVSDCDTVPCARANGWAFITALRTSTRGDEVVIAGNETLYFIPNTTDGSEPILDGLDSLVIRIDGRILLHDDTSAWPMVADDEYYNAIHIRQGANVTITGSGSIDGQGYTWWRKFLFNQIPRKRPTMIFLEYMNNTLVEHISLYDSPRFNIYSDFINGLEVRHMLIWVNATAQKSLVEEKTGLDLSFIPDIPGEAPRSEPPDAPLLAPLLKRMFPFNTDGVDFKGINVHVHNMTISNYDDVIVAKPSVFRGDGSPFDFCTGNAVVENIRVFTGAGLSIGSVPPYPEYPRCVRNVTFRDVEAAYPLKLVYVKTEHCSKDECATAIIDGITYERVNAYHPVLWPIYIGPQQQKVSALSLCYLPVGIVLNCAPPFVCVRACVKEPDGTGAGLWPPTEPLVNVSNVLLKDLNVTGSLLQAGVLRCNVSNPCRNINFENVHISGGRSDARGGYICDGDEGPTVYGNFDKLTDPSPQQCLSVA